ncbi:ketoacyl-synthetase C-terminal extension domain-containing protein, partial [Nonomuraea sp. NPDC048916]|uniref:ketoacyl-synthetase C-terminal extension domain-containing protein n=1 Tax=Nonomuraea sp. NPDC048916 TaxID=3154232 RepID=UPI0033EA8F8A
MTEAVEWRREGRPRRAGVSSFGLSGTNAHVILEEGPSESGSQVERPAPASVAPPAVPWLISARTPQALKAQAARLASDVAARPGTRPLDVAYSLLTSRARMEHSAVVGAEDLLRGLDGIDPIARVEGRTGFVFSGQGGQWVGMGRGLYERFGVFAGALDEVVGGFGGVVGGG